MKIWLTIVLLLFVFWAAGYGGQARAFASPELSAKPECTAVLSLYLEKRLSPSLCEIYKNEINSGVLARCSEYVELRDLPEGVQSWEVDAAAIDKKLAQMGVVVSDPRPVIVFVSEFIEDDFIDSFITALPSLMKGEVSRNECETIMDELFAARGFGGGPKVFDNEQKMKARSFRTVLGRYKDLSTLPNFTAAKAGSIITGENGAAVVCGVKVSGGSSSNMFESCAKVRCKAVDIATGGRIAASAYSSCEKNSDGTTANMAAIRSVCGAMGRALGANLVSRYQSINVKEPK